jgi:hypothetical protein
MGSVAQEWTRGTYEVMEVMEAVAVAEGIQPGGEGMCMGGDAGGGNPHDTNNYMSRAPLGKDSKRSRQRVGMVRTVVSRPQR